MLGELEHQVASDSRLILGDAANELKKLEDCLVQVCITSPPYWGTRDYGVEGQIGGESRLDEYLKHLRRVLAETRRVLRDDGVLWLNIGDTYTSGDRGWRAPDKKNRARAMSYRPDTPEGLKPKDLIGVPWRLALGLQEDGWYLRSDVIWHKPNAQPESVKDRPTRSHEYLFLFSKSERYYYDFEAVRERCNGGQAMRNRRTVWSIATEARHPSHLAVFPPDLVRLCILSGSKAGDIVLDPFMGSGTVGLVCRETNRRFIGIEIKREYVDIAAERMGVGDGGEGR